MSPYKQGMIAAAIAGTLTLGIANAQVSSAAAPSMPSPSAAAPVQQTPLPAATTAVPPPQSPSVTSPLQTPNAMQNPSASAPSGTATGTGTSALQNPNLATSPIQMPTSIPSKAETAPSAFDKLAASGSTFVTKEDADRLDGFDRAFSEADRDKDGKLTKEEFNAAWAIYTGRQ
jgi:hypothetical protein